MDLITVYKDLLPYLYSADRQLIYPVMHIIVSFGNEGIKIADMDTRKTLVKALYVFFKKVPKSCDKILYQEGRKHLFLNIIRHKWLLALFYDYLYRNASEQLLKKVFRKLKRK